MNDFRPLDATRRVQIRRLRRKGWKWRSICAAMGITHQEYKRALGIRPRRRDYKAEYRRRAERKERT